MGDRAIFITAGSQPFGIMYKVGHIIKFTLDHIKPAIQR
jgi:hypothetical protein